MTLASSARDSSVGN